MKILYKILFLTSIAVIYLSCDDTTTNVDNNVIPNSNISYSQHIQPIFNAKCVNCHGVGDTKAGLNLTTWAGTTADPSIVFPGEPDNSKLVWSIEGNPAVSPMPPIDSPYPALTQNQVNGVKTWIKEGAKNN
jgi:mono/diheme cytochrome c family protein